MRESYLDGVRTSAGNILVFTQVARGRWTAEGAEHTYIVTRNEKLWTTVVVDKERNHVVDVNDATTRQMAQEVAEEYEDLAPLYSDTGRALGLVRIALANRNVAQRRFPHDPNKWYRRVPRIEHLAVMAQFN